MGSENSTQNWANLIEASLFSWRPQKTTKKGTKKTSKNDPKNHDLPIPAELALGCRLGVGMPPPATPHLWDTRMRFITNTA